MKILAFKVNIWLRYSSTMRKKDYAKYSEHDKKISGAESQAMQQRHDCTIIVRFFWIFDIYFTSLLNDDSGLSKTTTIHNNNKQFILKCTIDMNSCIGVRFPGNIGRDSAMIEEMFASFDTREEG